MKRLLVILLLWSVHACAMDDYSELAERGIEAIELCLAEYTKVKGDDFPPEVDRAYIHASDDIFGVLFARGEVGTFGPRATNYQAFVSCMVMRPGMRVQELIEGYSVLIGENEILDEYGFYDGPLAELLYVRDGMKFVFRQGQVFAQDRIEELQFKDDSSPKN